MCTRAYILYGSAAQRSRVRTVTKAVTGSGDAADDDGTSRYHRRADAAAAEQRSSSSARRYSLLKKIRFFPRRIPTRARAHVGRTTRIFRRKTFAWLPTPSVCFGNDRSPRPRTLGYFSMYILDFPTIFFRLLSRKGKRTSRPPRVIYAVPLCSVSKDARA